MASFSCWRLACPALLSAPCPPCRRCRPFPQMMAVRGPAGPKPCNTHTHAIETWLTCWLSLTSVASVIDLTRAHAMAFHGPPSAWPAMRAVLFGQAPFVQNISLGEARRVLRPLVESLPPAWIAGLPVYGPIPCFDSTAAAALCARLGWPRLPAPVLPLASFSVRDSTRLLLSHVVLPSMPLPVSARRAVYFTEFAADALGLPAESLLSKTSGAGLPSLLYGGSELLPQERCGRHLPPGRSAVGALPFWTASGGCVGPIGTKRVLARAV